MKINLASNILKVLLILFAIGIVSFGAYVLPTMAEEMLISYPELEFAKLPILIICELLLVLLLTGIGIIMYLLFIFDKGFVFSLKFTRGLEVLIGMCILATIGLIILFQYISYLGGPDPLTGLIIVGTTFVILIVAMVIMLIRAIVKKAITYKTDYDLTV